METTQVNLGTASYRGRRTETELFGAMGTPGDFYTDTLHTIAINTRETEFGSIVEPIPITLKSYTQFHAHGHAINGYGYPQQQVLTSLVAAPRVPSIERPSTSTFTPSPVKEEVKEVEKVAFPPPKKKWIREYLGKFTGRITFLTPCECVTTLVTRVDCATLNIERSQMSCISSKSTCQCKKRPCRTVAASSCFCTIISLRPPHTALYA